MRHGVTGTHHLMLLSSTLPDLASSGCLDRNRFVPFCIHSNMPMQISSTKPVIHLNAQEVVLSCLPVMSANDHTCIITRNRAGSKCKSLVSDVKTVECLVNLECRRPSRPVYYSEPNPLNRYCALDFLRVDLVFR